MTMRLRQGQYYGSEIAGKEFNFFSLTISRYNSFDTIEKHCHENSYVSLLLNGAYTEKSGFETDSIQAGHLIFRPSLYDHSNTFNERGGVCFNFEINGNVKEVLNADINLPAKTRIYKANSIIPLFQLFSFLINDLGEDLIYEKAVESLFSLGDNPEVKPSLPWMDKTLKILDNETDCHHTTQSLSRLVHVHPVYLARAFRKKTGLTIGEYQINSKLKKACTLLLNSNLSVHEISRKSGFYDSAHFVNTFRFFFRKSPYQLRRLLFKRLI